MGENINNKNINVNQNATFIEPVNYTDPVVLHDPDIKVGAIVEPYEPQTKDDGSNNSNKPFDPVKVHAIRFPEILINNISIPFGKIMYMNIDYRDFLPSVIVKISDEDNYMRFKGLIQMNNEMIIVFTAPLDGLYKKVSLRFYITDQNFNDDGYVITYFATYKFEKFYGVHNNDLTFEGCQKCGAAKATQLSTWEMLHTISTLTGFGFATTDKCKDINDKLPRIMFAQNYKDFLIKHKQWAGFDEDSIFDYWIDLYGYIVMVNLSYLFSEHIPFNQLVMYSMPAINFEIDTMPVKKPTKVVRAITNYQPQMGIDNNLIFDEYSFEISNSGVNYALVHTTCFDINEGNNLINQNDVELVQNSVDGKHTEDYAHEWTKPIYVNFNNYDINLQKEIRKSFFNKHRQRILKIKMKHMNLALQRGTLLYVLIYEASALQKQTILSSTSNALATEDKLDKKDLSSDEIVYGNQTDNGEQFDKFSLFNGKTMMINMSVSGLYYIDGMTFNYSYQNQEIEQYLYLIKQGQLDGFSNKYTLPKMNVTI